MDLMLEDRVMAPGRRPPARVGIPLLLLAALAVPGCRWMGMVRPVVVALTSATETLDPHLHNETALWSVLANFYDGLTAFDRELRVVPALAVSWERLDGHRTGFRLRPGVRFHDGEPVTPADVVASLRRARTHPRSAISHHLVDVEDVYPDGNDGVIVVTTGPAATLANRLALVMVVPARLAGLDEIGEPVGTGAYRFVRRAIDGTIVARAATGWRRRPPVRSVHYRLGVTLKERLDMLLDGRVDVLAGLPDESLRELERHPTVRVLPQPRLSVQFLGVIPEAAPEPARSWLADRRVRRALLLGLNRREMVDRGYLGNGTVASQLVHPLVFGFDSSISPLPYDVAAARTLLAEAGPPPDVELVLGHGDVPAAIVDQIVRDLAALGIRVRPERMPFAQVWQRAQDGELPLVYYGRPSTTGDASEVLNPTVATRHPGTGWGRMNVTGYSNPVVDELLMASEAEAEPEVRRRLLQEAQREVLEDLPVLPLTIRFGHVGVSTRIDLTPRFDQWLLAAEFRWH